ncbi:hypothetical protein [Synechococcus phage DSL-LC02]|nr:hypothetical protein [Synechococcus phage DSL-LC02]
MTEQQQHLKSILEQQQSLAKEVEQLNIQTNTKKEMFFKLQGVVEYLTQLGVTLPQPEPESETPVSETEVVEG